MDYNKLAEMRDRDNLFAAFLGIKTTKVEEGYAEVELELRPEFMNATNVVHGGCLYTLGDVVSGTAASSFGTKAVTVSGEYQYLSAAKDTKKIKAVARCIKQGKTLLVFDVMLTDSKYTLVNTNHQKGKSIQEGTESTFIQIIFEASSEGIQSAHFSIYATFDHILYPGSFHFVITSK